MINKNLFTLNFSAAMQQQLKTMQIGPKYIFNNITEGHRKSYENPDSVKTLICDKQDYRR